MAVVIRRVYTGFILSCYTSAVARCEIDYGRANTYVHCSAVPVARTIRRPSSPSANGAAIGSTCGRTPSNTVVSADAPPSPFKNPLSTTVIDGVSGPAGIRASPRSTQGTMLSTATHQEPRSAIQCHRCTECQPRELTQTRLTPQHVALVPSVSETLISGRAHPALLLPLRRSAESCAFPSAGARPKTQ